MSYRQCIFGVTTKEMPGKKILGWVRNCMAEQASEGLKIPEVYLLLDDAARAKRAGVQLFMIGVREAGDRVLMRNPLFEYLVDTADGAGVLTLLHDDQRGVYRFERYARGSKPLIVSLLSDGPYLGETRAKLTVDYPQKDF